MTYSNQKFGGRWWSYSSTPQEMWAEKEFSIDPTSGLITWNSNNGSVPKDIVVAWNEVGLLSDLDTARAVTAYDTHFDLVLAAYRANQPDELQDALACLGEALRDHGIEFHGEIGHVFAVGTRVQVAFNPEQAIALAELIREREA